MTSVSFASTGPLPSIGWPSAFDDAADQRRADGHLEDAAGALDRVAFGDVLVVAQDHRADRVALEVEREAEGVVRELEHLALHRVLQAVDAADAVGHRHDGADAARLGGGGEVLDAGLDQVADLGSLDGHVACLCWPCRTRGRALRFLVSSSVQSRAARACSASDPSISRSPERTTAPPIRPASVLQLKRTSRFRRARSAVASRSLLALVERHRRDDLDVGDVLVIRHQFLELQGDLRQVVEPAVLGQQVHECAAVRVERGSCRGSEHVDQLAGAYPRAALQSPVLVAQHRVACPPEPGATIRRAGRCSFAWAKAARA